MCMISGQESVTVCHGNVIQSNVSFLSSRCASRGRAHLVFKEKCGNAKRKHTYIITSMLHNPPTLALNLRTVRSHNYWSLGFRSALSRVEGAIAAGSGSQPPGRLLWGNLINGSNKVYVKPLIVIYLSTKGNRWVDPSPQPLPLSS